MKYIEVLSAFKVDELKTLCQEFSLSGYSKLNKAELAAFVAERLTDKTVLTNFFSDISSEALDSFMRIYNKEDVEIEQEIADYFISLGFVYLKDNNLCVPTDIASKLKKIFTNDFVEKQKLLDNLFDYAFALINICGVVKLDKLVEIYNKQTGDAITSEKAEKFLEERFQIYDGMLVSDYFDLCGEDDCDDYIEDKKEFAELLEKQKGREIPELTAEDLLKYKDEFYYEKTGQTEALKRFFINSFHISNEEEAEDICENIIAECRLGSNIEITLKILALLGYEFKSEKQLEAFEKVYTQVFRETRMWPYCGHTPNECRKTVVAVGKIGRNDPCPCGSGKKYKKCCGR